MSSGCGCKEVIHSSYYLSLLLLYISAHFFCSIFFKYIKFAKFLQSTDRHLFFF